MKDVYPSYYDKFKCIANRCTDSCCKDWDVVVDSDTEDFYNSVHSELGEKIRRLTVTDGDGDRIFVSQNSRCPFWNSDMLCDIYIGLGEEHLCKTCKDFPRVTADFSDFSEHFLSFACPEAARLILAEDNAYESFEAAEYELCSEYYDADCMRLLLSARSENAKILSDRSVSMAQRLKDCLVYNSNLQSAIYGEEPEEFRDETEPKSPKFVYEFFKKLDYMHDDVQKLIELAESAEDKPLTETHDNEFEKLALYCLYRYYLNSIDGMDVLSPIKRIVGEYVILSNALTANPELDLLDAMQKYSKEIEHSYENNEELDFEFMTNPDFSVENLLNIL